MRSEESGTKGRKEESEKGERKKREKGKEKRKESQEERRKEWNRRRWTLISRAMNNEAVIKSITTQLYIQIQRERNFTWSPSLSLPSTKARPPRCTSWTKIPNSPCCSERSPTTEKPKLLSAPEYALKWTNVRQAYTWKPLKTNKLKG